MTNSTPFARFVRSSLIVGVAALLAAPAQAQELPPFVGSVVGATEGSALDAVRAAFDAAAATQDSVALGLGVDGTLASELLIDLAADVESARLKLSAAQVDVAMAPLLPTTNRVALQVGLDELGELVFELELALELASIGGSGSATLKDLLEFALFASAKAQQDAVALGRTLNGVKRGPKAPAPPTAFTTSGQFDFFLAFNGKAMRDIQKGAGAVRDPEGGKDVKVKNAKAKAAHDSVAVGKKKGPRNRYLSFKPRNKKVEDGSVFFDLRREWRGPFEFGFTGGVFTDKPKPKNYRGNAFVGMEVDLVQQGPREFLSANVRYAVTDDAGTQEGVQVFVASHLGDHGSTFLQGAKRVDVKVMYENERFEVFARRAGASEGSFQSVGSFEHGTPDAVWKPGVGAANMSGKVELGVDDVFARALGQEPGDGGGGGGGGGAIDEPAASAQINGEVFVPTQIAVDYSTFDDRLQVKLTNADGDQILVSSPVGTTDVGTYVPRTSGTGFLDLRGFTFQSFAMPSGQGTLTIDLLDTDAKLVRGTFEFTGRRGDGALREITEGTFETNRLVVR